jgi:Uncharacterized alpha/beta hydrolase domain (DUF2235)
MSKRIVIACDGTWNRPDQVHGGQVTPSNVSKIADAVADYGETEQLVFYERGVGTGGLLDRIGGGAVGVGLSQNVLAAYRYLAQHYLPGDDLYLFGFSRGAFTARSLAGLIGNCGILRSGEDAVQVVLLDTHLRGKLRDRDARLSLPSPIADGEEVEDALAAVERFALDLGPSRRRRCTSRRSRSMFQVDQSHLLGSLVWCRCRERW